MFKVKNLPYNVSYQFFIEASVDNCINLVDRDKHSSCSTLVPVLPRMCSTRLCRSCCRWLLFIIVAILFIVKIIISNFKGRKKRGLIWRHRVGSAELCE